ncbi:MAG: hypothetical protein ACREFR_02220, partial [Limisphaerales bacterium]
PHTRTPGDRSLPKFPPEEVTIDMPAPGKMDNAWQEITMRGAGGQNKLQILKDSARDRHYTK